jgi:Ca2+-binding EF-hand superfamily protein
MGRGLRKLGVQMSEEQVSAFCAQLDSDMNGKISLGEFVAAVHCHDPNAGAVLEAWTLILSSNSGIDGLNFSARQLFQSMDVTKCGSVDVNELRAWLRKQGLSLSEEQAAALFEEIDTNRNGRISQKELSRAIQKHRRPPKPSSSSSSSSSSNGSVVDAAWEVLLGEVEKAGSSWARSVGLMFSVLDRDKSGSIDVGELSSGLRKFGVDLSTEEVGTLRAELDLNGDGKITMEEFNACVESRRKNKRGGSKQSSLSRGRPSESARNDAKRVAEDVSSSLMWEALMGELDRDESGFMASVGRLFEDLDRDGSGSVDVREMAAGLLRVGIKASEAAVASFCRELDTDFDGGVSLSELMTAIKVRRPSQAVLIEAWRKLLGRVEESSSGEWEASVRRLFKSLDKNNSGDVDAKEMMLGLLKMGLRVSEAEASALCEDIDSDKDGRVSLQELREAIEKRKPKRAQANNNSGGSSEVRD